MNKKEAEKAIRELAYEVCVKHEVPDNGTMQALAESGYRLERVKLNYLDGLRATYPDGKMRYATCVHTAKGRQDRCTIYPMEDVHLYETCTRMLIEAEDANALYQVDCYSDNIASDGLRSEIREACEQLRKKYGYATPAELEADPGQDDETPLECYEGFTEEPAHEPKAEPVENPLEWLKRAHEGITVSRKNEKACWWVSGNTKPIKDKLKAMGFKWAPKKKMWYLRPVAA